MYLLQQCQENTMELTPENILGYINENNEVSNSRDLCTKMNWDHEKLFGICMSLVSKEMIVDKMHSDQIRSLTAEGRKVLENGSPEFLVYQGVGTEGTSKADLEV